MHYNLEHNKILKHNTSREQSNKKNIYDVGWRPSHGENGGVGTKTKTNKKKKKKTLPWFEGQFYTQTTHVD